jgi:branched-chain amino acid transport system substrate-binding protein
MKLENNNKSMRFFGMLTALVLSHGVVAYAEVGVTDNQVLIGRSFNLSGPNSERALEIKQSSDILFDLVNRRGGVHGRKIKVITYDDAYAPERTVQNAKKLLNDDKVFLLYEFFGTKNSKAVMPLVESSGVPFIFPASGARDVYIPIKKFIFALRFSYNEEAEAVVEYLVKSRHSKRVAIVYQEDGAGYETRSGVQRALGKAGLKPVAEIGFNNDHFDVKKTFNDVMLEKPDVVILGMLYKPAAEFAKFARANKADFVMGGPTLLSTDVFLQEAKEAANGIVIGASLPNLGSDIAVVSKFKTEVAASGRKVVPNVEGYLNGLVLIEALKRAGRELTRDKLIEAFESIKDYDLGGVKVTFGPDRHVGAEKPILSEVKNQKFIRIQD